MSVHIQIISFISFFLYGTSFCLLNGLLHKKKIIFCLLIPLLTIFYMYFLYGINGGRIHVYFIAVFLLGILTSKVAVNFIKKRLTLLKIKKKK